VQESIHALKNSGAEGDYIICKTAKLKDKKFNNIPFMTIFMKNSTSRCHRFCVPYSRWSFQSNSCYYV